MGKKNKLWYDITTLNPILPSLKRGKSSTLNQSEKEHRGNSDYTFRIDLLSQWINHWKKRSRLPWPIQTGFLSRPGKNCVFWQEVDKGIFEPLTGVCPNFRNSDCFVCPVCLGLLSNFVAVTRSRLIYNGRRAQKRDLVVKEINIL